MDRPVLPITASVIATTRLFGISRSRVYELIAAGEIDTRKAGRTTLVLTASVERWLDKLPPARGNSIRPKE